MRLIDIFLRARSTRLHANGLRALDRRPPRALALLALAVIAGSASAQPSPRAEQLFDRLDSNSDGVIDEEELTAARRAAFERADANSDGYVDGDELSELENELQGAVSGPRSAPMHRRFGQRQGSMAATDRLQRMDTNRDGRISQTELVAAPSPLLRFDRDGDGRITRAELDAARARSNGAKRRGRRL